MIFLGRAIGSGVADYDLDVSTGIMEEPATSIVSYQVKDFFRRGLPFNTNLSLNGVTVRDIGQSGITELQGGTHPLSLYMLNVIGNSEKVPRVFQH